MQLVEDWTDMNVLYLPLFVPCLLCYTIWSYSLGKVLREIIHTKVQVRDMSELITLLECLCIFFLNARNIWCWHSRHLWIIIIGKTHTRSSLPIHTLCLPLQETGFGWLYLSDKPCKFSWDGGSTDWCVVEWYTSVRKLWENVTLYYLFFFFYVINFFQIWSTILHSHSLNWSWFSKSFIFGLNQHPKFLALLPTTSFMLPLLQPAYLLPSTVSIPGSLLLHMPKMLYRDLLLYRFKSSLTF